MVNVCVCVCVCMCVRVYGCVRYFKCVSICVCMSVYVWVGNYNKGLQYFDPQQDDTTHIFTQYNGFDILKQSRIVHMREDQNSRDILWLSTIGGWYRLHIRDGILERYWPAG